MVQENGVLRHVRILDVAKASGFSPSTVSIVLNDAPLSQHVAAATKLHIRKIAETMGYRPDASARSLRARRSHLIGVMIFDISDPICTVILHGIEQALDPTSFLPIIMDAHNQHKQFERYLELLLERRVEGLIVVANWLFSDSQLLPEFKKNGIPMVVVGRDLATSEIQSIVVDNEAGGYLAVKHLHDLGHRSIAYIRGPQEMQDSIERWAGIRRFARSAKVPINKQLVRQLTGALDPHSGFHGGYDLTKDLLERKEPFTAVVAFDDLTALGVTRALYEGARAVPHDCSVIGFDNVPQAALSTPALTTIGQPMERMGLEAARWMLAQLGDPTIEVKASPMRARMAPELFVRASTQELAEPL